MLHELWIDPVPKWVTLNGVMALFCVISPNSVAFRAH